MVKLKYNIIQECPHTWDKNKPKRQFSIEILSDLTHPAMVYNQGWNERLEAWEIAHYLSGGN